METHPQHHDERRSDAKSYEAMLAGPWELEYRQLSAGRFAGSNAGLTLGETVVYEEAFNLSVSVFGGLRPGLLGFSLPNRLARDRGRWWGSDYPSSAISFAAGGQEIDVAFPGGYRNYLVLVPERAFRNRYHAVTGQDATFLENSFPHIRVAPKSSSTCRLALKQLMSIPEGVVLPEDAVVSVMVETIANGMVKTPARQHITTPRARSRVVREAIDLWKASNYSLTIGELSSYVGVAQRTLEHGFRERFDFTPYQYLYRCRLGLVRAELAHADPADNSVTEIALQFGFYELGRFAGAYRRFFGELPSETLSRTERSRQTPIFS